jgi:acetate---CoA ligase (ADP-forming)
MMRGFFYPTSVALFGISSSPSNLGRQIVENMDRFSFKGAIYLFGEREGTISGRIVHRHLEEIDEVPDIAVLLIPARKVAAQLEECGKKGILNVVVESGGFSEFGEQKKVMEEEILAIASKWGMKIMGPNCIGVTNAENGLLMPFYPVYPREIKLGPVSIISQSGGLVHDLILLATAEDLGVNKLVSIGNKLMIDENDCLEYLISDPATKAVGLYLENFADGRRLMDLAGSTSKPVVLLKGNISPSGKEIAKFHTASLAGDGVIADAALHQAGIHRVHTLKELVDALKVFTLPLLRGPRLGLLTRSGGHAVLAADAAFRHNFTLATFPEELFTMANKEKRGEVIRMTNPLDLGDIFDLKFQAAIAEKALENDGVDGIVFAHGYNFEEHGADTRTFIQDARMMVETLRKPVALCMISGREEWFSMKEASGFPIFTESEDGISALAKSLDHFRHLSRRGQGAQRMGLYRERGKMVPPQSTEIMDVAYTFSSLAAAGLPVAPYAVVRNREEALAAAHRIGYPVALKVASPLILHKTESGAVKLNIVDGSALERGMREMTAQSYLIQGMSPSGYEVIIGARRDPEFGPVLLFGLGGVLTEVLKDTAIRVAPVDPENGKEMVAEIKGASILKGFRGQPPADTNALTGCLLKVSALLMEKPEIVNLDINPLIVLGEGMGCTVVDAKLELITVRG